MRRIRLELDELAVESFTTDTLATRTGTVQGHGGTAFICETAGNTDEPGCDLTADSGCGISECSCVATCYGSCQGSCDCNYTVDCP